MLSKRNHYKKWQKVYTDLSSWFLFCFVGQGGELLAWFCGGVLNKVSFEEELVYTGRWFCFFNLRKQFSYFTDRALKNSVAEATFN